MLVFIYHVFSLPLFKYLIPVFLLAIPYVIQRKINLRFSLKDSAIGITASVVLLLPFWFLFSQGKTFNILPANAVLFQIIGVSLPEEVYFRGFLQDRLGNNIRGLLAASILFSFMHIPQFIFYGDLYSLLTFFPSLVMGFLYLRTSNVLPSAIFHLLSNILFLSFL